MCRELDALSRSITGYAAGFTASSLSPAEAASVVRTCARMEASLASVKALAAARSAEGDSWKAQGYRSPADQLAHEAGMSPGSARRTLQTGQRLATQPDVAAAALAGELTAEQAAAVSDGAATDPSRARDLIERARWATVPELHQEVARAKAGRTDLEACRAAIHARRSLTRWTDPDGATRARIATGRAAELSFTDLTELGLFPGAHQDAGQPSLFGSPDPPARTKKLAGSADKVIVRVDLDTLLRGWPIEGETCEITGWGPIPVSLVDQLLSRDATVLAVALTRAGQVQAVHHHRRHPNGHQKTALELLYPTCAAAGCPARTGLQADHRRDWQHTHYTAFDYLDRLCPHHHKLKTHHGWALVDGTGKRDFVPPDHPRHPDHRPDPPPPPEEEGPRNGRREAGGGRPDPGGGQRRPGAGS